MSSARLTTLLVVLAVMAALAPTGAGASSLAAAPRAERTTATSAPDFATQAYGHAWDGAPDGRIRLLADRVSPGMNPRYADGQLRMDITATSGMITWLFPGYAGSLHMNRDGGATPIDADRYTHLSMRLYASTRRVMNIGFDTGLAMDEGDSPTGRIDSTRTANVFVEPGWQTLTLDMRQLGGAAWSGRVFALDTQHAGPAGWAIDWLSVHGEPQTIRVDYDGPGDLWWDADGDTGNNTDGVPAGARFGRVPGGAWAVGAMPPGTYRLFGAKDPRKPLSEATTVQVRGAPAPQISAPHLRGGEDYATARLGRPWDFRDPASILIARNVQSVRFGPEGLHARNGPPLINQPHFYLPVGNDLDPARYHRLTVETTYEGAFDLRDIAGGGTHGRLSWTAADMDQHLVIEGNKVAQTRELVHYPDETSFTVDLKDPAPGAQGPVHIFEPDLAPGMRPRGWSGPRITHVRYDPNEDRGERVWNIRRISLRADHEARGGFEIVWNDASTTPTGTTVDLFWSADPSGRNPQPIVQGIAQRPGENRYLWDTAGVPAGRKWIVVVASDGQERVRAVSSGPVNVIASSRTAGPSRHTTAVALSRLGFPEGAPAAVIARDTTFPDALAAAPLAAALGGPLLLNPSDQLLDVVAEELGRLGVTEVHLMGGTAALSGSVAASLDGLGLDVRRHGGSDRFETAAAGAVAAADQWTGGGAEPRARRVLLARGDDFADALAAGPFAGYAQLPLVLTAAAEPTAATLDALDALGAEHVTIVGGQRAVGSNIERELERRGLRVDRIAGSNRFATADLLARAAVSAGGDDLHVIVASGETFPDALAAGPAALGQGGVMLLTASQAVPAETLGWLRARAGDIELLRTAGGSAAISDPTEAALRAAVRS